MAKFYLVTGKAGDVGRLQARRAFAGRRAGTKTDLPVPQRSHRRGWRQWVTRWPFLNVKERELSGPLDRWGVSVLHRTQ